MTNIVYTIELRNENVTAIKSTEVLEYPETPDELLQQMVEHSARDLQRAHEALTRMMKEQPAVVTRKQGRTRAAAVGK